MLPGTVFFLDVAVKVMLLLKVGVPRASPATFRKAAGFLQQ
jgi:hypothetical protein